MCSFFVLGSLLPTDIDYSALTICKCEYCPYFVLNERSSAYTDILLGHSESLAVDEGDDTSSSAFAWIVFKQIKL